MIYESTFADFLNTAFSGFDSALLSLASCAHEASGALLDPLFSFITLFGEGGIFLILLSLVLSFIPKTRRLGITMLVALAIGAILTNLCLKPIVARARPYEASEIFREYWLAVGHGAEKDLSFPSGHTTASFAAAVAFLLAGNRRYSWLGLVPAFLIALSRIYLAVHYPSDVLGGMIVGIAAGIAAYYIICALTPVVLGHLKGIRSEKHK